MAYVVYNKRNWRILKKADRSNAVFDSERAAKAFRTRAVNNPGRDPFVGLVAEQIVVDTFENYRATEPMVETYNMLNPNKKIMIRLSDKGGCCDPATESYHSM